MINKTKKFSLHNPDYNPALLRLPYMIAFGVVAYILIWPLLALSVIQFGFHLFEGIPNSRLVSLSSKIITYLSQILIIFHIKVILNHIPFHLFRNIVKKSKN